MEIDVDLPLDIIENNNRREAVEEGLVRSISKGLYEEGVSFKIKITIILSWIAHIYNKSITVYQEMDRVRLEVSELLFA